MKKRLIAGGLALLFFLWLSLVISSNFGLLLTGRRADCTLLPVGMLTTLLADSRGSKLFLLLALGSILLVLWMLFGHSYLNYKSDMYEVVPGFSIPRPEGQGQHGTAWFMAAIGVPLWLTAAKGGGIGGGDVKLCAALGALLGLEKMLFLLILALLSLTASGKLRKKRRLPFAPFVWGAFYILLVVEIIQRSC